MTDQTWIWTSTGRQVDYMNPDPDYISLDDITNHLIREGRFCGATSAYPEQYSVLHHSLYCDDLAGMLWSPPVPGVVQSDPARVSLDPDQEYDIAKLRICVLLHDAHEAYTKDLPSPLKALCPFIKDVQNRLDYAIFTHFGVDLDWLEAHRLFIKELDQLSLLGEARAFMPEDSQEYWMDQYRRTYEKYTIKSLINLPLPSTELSYDAAMVYRVRLLGLLSVVNDEREVSDDEVQDTAN